MMRLSTIHWRESKLSFEPQKLETSYLLQQSRLLDCEWSAESVPTITTGPLGAFLFGEPPLPSSETANAPTLSASGTS